MRPGLLAASLGLKSVPHTLPETLPNIPALYPLGQFVMYYLARNLFLIHLPTSDGFFW